MASFKYIGSMTKTDGTIDVVVPQSNGSKIKYSGITPGVAFNVGNDAWAIQALEYAVDPMGQFIYERVS